MRINEFWVVFAAFVVSALVGELFLHLFGDYLTNEFAVIAFNVVATLAVNVITYMLICGKPVKSDPKKNYSRIEPLAFLCAAMFLSCVASLVMRLIFKAEGGTEAPPSIAYAVYTVVLAPIAEEIAFRGAALNRLRGLGDNSAALLSALFFAGYHYNSGSFLYMTVLGYFLAILAIRSGNIIMPILAHAANNLLVIVADTSETASLVIDIVLPMAGLAAIVWLVATGRLWRKSKRKAIPFPRRPKSD